MDLASGGSSLNSKLKLRTHSNGKKVARMGAPKWKQILNRNQVAPVRSLPSLAGQAEGRKGKKNSI